MNLVKWFRKNNTKVMAVVVIVLMVGFVGGSSLHYLLQGSQGAGDTVAHYGAKRQKITRMDRHLASQELEILQALRLDRVMQSQDLRGLLLGQLLFTQSQGSAPIMETIRQAVQQNRYRIGDKQINEMTQRTVPTDIYWLLLRNEADAAGFRLPPEDVGSLLGNLIPQLFPGETYATVMRAQVNRFGVPEGTIVATFGKLLAVLQYSEAICSLGNTTTSQLRRTAVVEGESMDIEFVKIEAETFADKKTTPSESELIDQFDKYKDLFPGQVSQTNPHGFGYRLPARVQLEYIVVKLDEVASVVKAPTAQEMETFYQQNRDQLYTQQVASDPNDPNSPKVARVRSYAEVAETIRTRLLRERVATKAQQVLLDARNLADAKLKPIRSEETKPSIEQLRTEAGNYQTIAQDLGQKHGLTLYSGRTGLLSAADVQQDEHLGRLALTDYGYNPIRLTQMVFSVEELGDDTVTLLSAPGAEMYRSIGPARDTAATMTTSLAGKVMALIRIVDVKKAGPPEGLDATFSTKTLGLSDSQTDDLYSVREKVIEDVRTLAAWDTAKSKAAEFVGVAAKDGWDQAVNELNKLYREQTNADPNDPNVFSLDRMVGVQPISSEQLSAIEAQAANNPAAAEFVQRLSNERLFVDRLFALVPPDSNSLPPTPVVMEYLPEQSLYCIKSISIERLTQERFRQMKGMLLQRDRYTDAQNLAMVHFMPKNILQRMQFEFIDEGVMPAKDDTPVPPIQDAF
jgi:hypothetical protein